MAATPSPVGSAVGCIEAVSSQFFSKAGHHHGREAYLKAKAKFLATYLKATEAAHKEAEVALLVSPSDEAAVEAEFFAAYDLLHAQIRVEATDHKLRVLGSEEMDAKEKYDSAKALYIRVKAKANAEITETTTTDA